MSGLCFLINQAPLSGFGVWQRLNRQDWNGLRSIVGPKSQFLLFLTINLNLFLINRCAGHFFAWIIGYAIIIKLVHASYLLSQLRVILEFGFLDVSSSRVDTLLNSYLLLFKIITRRDVWRHLIVLGQILSQLEWRPVWAIIHLYPIKLHFLIIDIITLRWVLYCGLVTGSVLLRIFTIDF